MTERHFMSIHTDAAFFERDYERDGFEWLDCQNADYAVYAFVRKAKKQEVLVILNFDHTDIYDYKISFPGKNPAICCWTATIFSGAEQIQISSAFLWSKVCSKPTLNIFQDNIFY